MMRSFVVALAWWVSVEAALVDEDADAKKSVLLQEEAKVVGISEHLINNYLQNDGTAVPAFNEEDRSEEEEEASSFTGYAWTPKGIEMGKKADFFHRMADPVAGSAVLTSELKQFGEAGVASPTVLAEYGYIQTESPTALTMEEAEEQASLLAWTPKGIRKGLKAAFFQEGSVPSAGQTVTAHDFKQFAKILSAKTENPANMLLESGYLAIYTPGGPLSFVSQSGKGRRGKGRKGKARKGKGRKGKGRKGKGRKGKGRKGKGRKGKGREGNGRKGKGRAQPMMLDEETAEIGGEDDAGVEDDAEEYDEDDSEVDEEDDAEEYDEDDSEVDEEDSEGDSDIDYDSEEEQNDPSTDYESDEAEGSGEEDEA